MTIETTYCANHPTRETGLRCNRCEKYICPSCAVLTPTGYRCKECVRSMQKVFDNASWYDYLIGIAVTSGLSLVASILLAVVGTFIGFFMLLITIIAAPSAGVLIANIAQAALRRRRAKWLFVVTAAGVVVGALPVVLFLLFTGNLFPLIWQGIFLFLATSTVYARLSGIQFTR